MPSNKRQWRPWRHDSRIEVTYDDGGIWIRVRDSDFGYRESTWCKLVGSEDATVRILLHEMSHVFAGA
jgi:hypothetical protein